MTVTLTIIAGPEQGRSFACDHELIIGREDADVVVADHEVSGRHAALRPAEGGVEIEDLGSASGTFVDGERLSGPTVLSDDAEVKLGATRFAVAVRLPDDVAAVGDTRPPEVRVRQEAVTAVRDVPPPPPSARPGGGPAGGSPPFGGGPPGRRPPPPIRLLAKTPLGRAMIRRRMAKMAKRGRPPGPRQG